LDVAIDLAGLRQPSNPNPEFHDSTEAKIENGFKQDNQRANSFNGKKTGLEKAYSFNISIAAATTRFPLFCHHPLYTLSNL
jgi:hypothetical protein